MANVSDTTNTSTGCSEKAHTRRAVLGRMAAAVSAALADPHLSGGASLALMPAGNVLVLGARARSLAPRPGAAARRR